MRWICTRIAIGIVHAIAEYRHRIGIDVFKVILLTSMLCQCTALNETFTTNTACVWLLAGVTSNVQCQVIALRECSIAVGAFVRSYAGMDSLKYRIESKVSYDAKFNAKIC